MDCISCSIFSSDSLHHLDSPEPVDMLIVDGALCNPHGGSHAFAICIICMAILTMSRWIFWGLAGRSLSAAAFTMSIWSHFCVRLWLIRMVKSD